MNNDDIDLGDYDEVEVPETITVPVKAFLTVNLFIQGAQRNAARTILVTDTESETGPDGPAESFIGVDGETGEAVRVTVSYPDRD